MIELRVLFALALLAVAPLPDIRALGQENAVSPANGVRVQACTESLGKDGDVNFSAITAALQICSEVSRSEALGFSINTLALKDHPVLAQDSRLILSKISLASISSNSDTVAFDSEVIKAKREPLTNQGKLGIASAIIGIIGGGAGGSLHLVNSPQVSHAATVVGISAGVVGGSIAGVSSYLYARDQKKPLLVGSSEKKEPSLLLQRFAFVKEGREMDKDLLYTNPQRFADLLFQMTDSLNTLQSTTLNANVLNQLF